MRFLDDIPIKRKLTLIAMLTTGLALALACTAFAIYDQVVLRRQLIANLSTTAQLIGFNSASALSFNDPESAGQTLESLRAQTNVIAACVYGRDGARFATYARAGATGDRFPEKIDGGERAWFAGDMLEVVRPIDLAGERVGFIVLHTDLVAMRERLVRSAAIFLVVFLSVGLVAYFVVARLQRVISEPISRLAAVAVRVATEHDYSVRAVKHGNDEVGALIDGFNAMLTQIQSHDTALKAAHDELEQRVDLRTRELASSIALLNATLDATTDGIVAADFEGRVVCFNSQYASMWKFPPEILARRDAAEMIRFAGGQTRDPQGFAERTAAMLAAPESHPSDTIELADGQTFERYVQLQRVNGINVGVVVSFRDVTERRQAQEAVAHEKARFKFIFDSVPVGICLAHFRADGGREGVLNDAHLAICGLDRHQAVEGAFRRLTHPADAAVQEDLQRQVEAGTIDRFTLEKRYVRPDGTTVWVSFTLQRQRRDDGSHLDLSTVVDITALKVAQEQVAAERARLQFIFEAVPVSISLVTPGEEGAQLVNPAHERITGIPPARLTDPGVFERATHPDDWSRQRPLVQSYKRGDIDRFTLEKRYIHPDGRIVWASLERRMFTDAATGRKLSITTLVDITERKAAEERLSATHKQLLETSRQAGMAEVATGVLHNVGNVLNSANVSTTLLTDLVRDSKVTNVGKLADLLAEQQRDLPGFFASDPRAGKVPGFVQALAAHLKREQSDVLKELASLRTSIEHIKDIVAMQQSYAKVSGVSELVPVADLVEDALRMTGGGVRPDLELVREFAINPTVAVEKHKVLQILVNLLRNARYACEDSNRTDKRIVLRVSEAAERVNIAVIDNGVGIPPENLTRIFSHGFTTRKNGHGFGLHSGALAAKELGGALRAYSDGVGLGAMFVLELPLSCAAKAA